MRKPVTKRKPTSAKKQKPTAKKRKPPAPKPAPSPSPSPGPRPKGPIQHVVIIVKENHAFDNYFGRFPGADGDPNLALASDPPASDHPHNHAAWLNRANIAAREQYDQPNIPNYWRSAPKFPPSATHFPEVGGT